MRRIISYTSFLSCTAYDSYKAGILVNLSRYLSTAINGNLCAFQILAPRGRHAPAAVNSWKTPPPVKSKMKLGGAQKRSRNSYQGNSPCIC